MGIWAKALCPLQSVISIRQAPSPTSRPVTSAVTVRFPLPAQALLSGTSTWRFLLGRMSAERSSAPSRFRSTVTVFP